ncbi:hypothetical protein ACFS7Z_23960 [Pontibacter toksunensis]|uniref:Uncharacterized protein n=1 Tax=Pontibacter toksunensis TaxID=1332631 RepID=A0ABW6C028_9BACT
MSPSVIIRGCKLLSTQGMTVAQGQAAGGCHKNRDSFSRVRGFWMKSMTGYSFAFATSRACVEELSSTIRSSALLRPADFCSSSKN